MRILFMGTPDIAAECLKALYAAGHEICGVYTRRDKPVGRKQVLTAPPVKEVALEHGTPVFQPRTLRDGSEDANIQALAPELIVVVAYGCILPRSVLEAPKYGCINLHVSLLPKYRGSAPVQWAEFKLSESAAHIHNWVRGMNPWPMAWFVTGGKKVKVTECHAVASNGEAPGTVLATKPLTVACADGAIQLLHVVPEGKKPMDGTSFAAGLRLKAGDTL